MVETWHVYVRHSGIDECSSNLADSDKRLLQIVEYGFGTGIGFLLTAALAESMGVPIRFISLEQWLLSAEILEGIQPILSMKRAFPEEWQIQNLEACQGLFDEMISWRRSLPDSCPNGEYRFRSQRGTELVWIIGDATRYSGEPESTHCVYFDPFSPKTNPDLWSIPVLRSAFQSLVVDGRFCSYSVASPVRKMLTEIGFEVERLPGPPGGKRQVLLATKRR